MRKQVLKMMSLLSIAMLAVLCMPQRSKADDDDPPTRVARVGYIRGSVSFQPAGTDDWVDASVNRPMTTGDKLWSDSDGRVELHMGTASIRLSNTTGFSFLNLSDSVTQVRLTEGTIRLRVKRLDENETFEVDTPNLAFSVLRTGIYEINVNDGGDTTIVTVRSGEGEVTGGGSAYTVRANEIGNFYGTDEINADVQSYQGDEDNDFDQWAAQRDAREDHSQSARYVSNDAIGYEDLDDYGGWRPTPEYGTIWFPRESETGWAPYHNGHWAYVAPWGYTWVDDAPWGFAPFHYGRWVNVQGAWGWVPCPPRPVATVGVVYVRPVYAPALVAWVGGPRAAVAIGVGGVVGVGWFPLGPREVYVPSYPVSRNYVNNVNVSNTTVNTTVVNNYYNTTVINKNTTVTNVKYVNQSVPGAVAATTPQAFTSAQSVSKNVVKVDARQAAAAPVVYSAPAVTPTKESVLGGRAAAKVAPPAALQTRAVVAKVAPPPPPVTFAKRAEAIQANGGRPLAAAQVKQIQPAPAVAAAAHPAVKVAPPAKQMAPQNNRQVVNTPTGAKPGQPAPANNNKPGTPANTPAANNPANANRQVAPGQQPAQTNNNRPNAPATNVPANNEPANKAVNGNRPPNATQPANQPPANANKPNQPVNNAPQNGNRAVNDRPTTATPPPANRPNAVAPNANANANAQLEQKHAKEAQQLRDQQAQERQKVQAQQEAEHQKLAQQNADQKAKAQVEERHQQQDQQLQQKHAAEQQQLQKQQQQEKQTEKNKPAKEEDKNKPHR